MGLGRQEWIKGTFIISFKSWKEILELGKDSSNQDVVDDRKNNVKPDDLATLIYTSGTTGKPKCICHKTGGVLLQHLKEHQLHCDIKENDNVLDIGANLAYYSYFFRKKNWTRWQTVCSGTNSFIC